MSEVRLREMTRRDLRAVAAIERASFPEPWSESLLRSELAERSTRRYSVAVLDRRIIGYLGLMFVEDQIHVNTIATDPDARHEKVATRLLLDGIDAALQRGVRRLTLEVAVSNEAAQRLYRWFGLAPVGVRKGYYRGEDALVMWGGDLLDPVEVARRDQIAASLGSSR